MVISAALRDEMFAHALDAPLAPNGAREEACGILAGTPATIAKFYPAINAEHSPTRFVVDAQDQLRILKDIYANDWDLVGIFHSHTHTQAYPSSTDVNLAANWPDAYYLIASLMNEEPLLRAFRIVNGQVEEEPITIQD